MGAGTVFGVCWCVHLPELTPLDAFLSHIRELAGDVFLCQHAVRSLATSVAPTAAPSTVPSAPLSAVPSVGTSSAPSTVPSIVQSAAPTVVPNQNSNAKDVELQQYGEADIDNESEEERPDDSDKMQVLTGATEEQKSYRGDKKGD